jgi:hypothetical protein
VYDMYPWDSANQGDYPPGPLRSRRAPSAKTPQPTRPAQAVQVALDRRDNGGDGVVLAGPPVTQPATGRNRQ